MFLGSGRMRMISTKNPTLNQVIIELQEECQNVVSLVHQLQLADLSDQQKGKILSELLAASIHLHSHCDEGWQDMISDELEALTD